MKNKYFEMVKDRLKQYKVLQARKRVMMSKYLSAGDPHKNMSTDYSQIPAGSHVSNTKNKMDEALIKSEELMSRYSFTIKEIDELDMAMESLRPIYKQVISLRYIDGLEWGLVSAEVGYSERQCKRIAKAAIARIADIFYGEDSYDLPIYEYYREIV